MERVQLVAVTCKQVEKDKEHPRERVEQFIVIPASYDPITSLCVHKSLTSVKYWDVSDPKSGWRLNGDKIYKTQREASQNLERYRETLDKWIPSHRDHYEKLCDKKAEHLKWIIGHMSFDAQPLPM